jgi:hypothetical protein
MANLLPRLSREWANLDAALSSISTLQRVHISIPCTGDLLTDGILRIEMRGRLHQLHMGILSPKTGENVGKVYGPRQPAYDVGPRLQRQFPLNYKM